MVKLYKDYLINKNKDEAFCIHISVDDHNLSCKISIPNVFELYLLKFFLNKQKSCLAQAPSELENLYERCIHETQVDRVIAEKARLHDLTFDDPKGKCFLKCICTNAGFCDKDLKLVTTFLEQGTDIDKDKVRRCSYSRIY